MKKTLFKLNKRIMSQSVSLIAVFAVLVVTLVAYLPNVTLGWFAKNPSVTAKGMSTQAYRTQFDVYYRVATEEGDGSELTWSEWNLIDDGEMLQVAQTLKAPGDEVTFELKIVNKGNRAVTIEGAGLAAPPNSEYESPKAVAGEGGAVTYHFLSTELYTELDSIYLESNTSTSSVNGTVNSTRVFLRNEGASSANSIDYLNQYKLAENSEDAKIVITPGEANAVIIRASLCFWNRVSVVDGKEVAVDQNVFKNFDNYGNCKRSLFFYYEEIDNQ